MRVFLELTSKGEDLPRLLRPFLSTAGMMGCAMVDKWSQTPFPDHQRFARPIEGPADRLAERLTTDPAERARLGHNGRADVEQQAGRDAALRAYQGLLADPPGQSGLQAATAG